MSQSQPAATMREMADKIERLQGALDECNVTVLIAHALDHQMIEPRVVEQFEAALSRMNAALLKIQTESSDG